MIVGVVLVVVAAAGGGGFVGVGGGPLSHNSTMACPTCSSRFRASLDFVQEFHSVVFKLKQTDPKNSSTNVHRDAQHVHRKNRNKQHSKHQTALHCF